MAYKIWAIRGNLAVETPVPMRVCFDDYVPPNREFNVMVHLNKYESFILEQLKIPKSDFGWRRLKNDSPKKDNIK